MEMCRHWFYDRTQRQCQRAAGQQYYQYGEAGRRIKDFLLGGLRLSTWKRSIADALYGKDEDSRSGRDVLVQVIGTQRCACAFIPSLAEIWRYARYESGRKPLILSQWS
ncbi:MAG: hypothetical protein U0528_16105 [Anaerolineae bacterium]